MPEFEYLVCPNHPGEVVRLVEVEDDEFVECLRCEEVYINWLKYPVQQVYNHTTGEYYLKNVLTGEIVGPDGEPREVGPMPEWDLGILYGPRLSLICHFVGAYDDVLCYPPLPPTTLRKADLN